MQGLGATAAGAAVLPFVAILFVLSRWAGTLVDRFGSKPPLVIGPLIAATVQHAGRTAKYRGRVADMDKHIGGQNQVVQLVGSFEIRHDVGWHQPPVNTPCPGVFQHPGRQIHAGDMFGQRLHQRTA